MLVSFRLAIDFRCRSRSEMHHGTGDRAPDAFDELDLANDHAAEVVYRLALGTGDPVVRAVHAFRRGNAVNGCDLPGDIRPADLGLNENVCSDRHPRLLALRPRLASIVMTDPEACRSDCKGRSGALGGTAP